MLLHAGAMYILYTLLRHHLACSGAVAHALETRAAARWVLHDYYSRMAVQATGDFVKSVRDVARPMLSESLLNRHCLNLSSTTLLLRSAFIS